MSGGQMSYIAFEAAITGSLFVHAHGHSTGSIYGARLSHIISLMNHATTLFVDCVQKCVAP